MGNLHSYECINGAVIAMRENIKKSKINKKTVRQIESYTYTIAVGLVKEDLEDEAVFYYLDTYKPLSLKFGDKIEIINSKIININSNN